MNKIKPLSKKHRFRRWLRRLFGFKPRASDLLANIDEMHEERPSWMYTDCPCCGAKIPLYGTARREPRPDGRTIAQTIVDEVPTTDYQKKMIDFLKEVAPDYPDHAYKIAAVNLDALHTSPYADVLARAAEYLDGTTTTRKGFELNIQAVDKEEHLKMHQCRK